MTVLHVIDTLGRGGAEQQLLTLLPALVRQGCPAQVAVMRPPYCLRPALEAAGIPVHTLPERHKWNLPGAARAIADLAAAQQVQVVHAHLYFPAVTVAMMRLFRRSPVRTVVSFHNLAYGGANAPGLGLWAKKHLAAALYPRGMDRTIAVSQAVADHYAQALGIARPKVVYNSVELPEPPAAPVRDTPRIVVPGRLVPEKGHKDLIQALTLLETPVDVVFAGGGPLQEQLAQQAPQVRITGVLPHADMIAEIAAADVVVIPSRHEGFGLTAAEAMLLARPVIATTVGGLPEVVGQTGTLVPVGQPTALAQAIETLLADPERRAQQGQAGQARVRQLFAPMENAARMIDIYQQITQAGPT